MATMWRLLAFTCFLLCPTGGASPARVDLNGAVAGKDFSITSYFAQEEVVIVGPNATITGFVNPIAWMTVRLVPAPDGAQEALSAQVSGTITTSYTSATGTLRIQGSGSQADYQTILRTVAYKDSLANRTLGHRFATFVVSDGTTNTSAVSMITLEQEAITLPCASNPCANGGVCADVLLTDNGDTNGLGSGSGDGGDDPYGFVCFCLPSWTGIDCTIPSNSTTTTTTTTFNPNATTTVSFNGTSTTPNPNSTTVSANATTISANATTISANGTTTPSANNTGNATTIAGVTTTVFANFTTPTTTPFLSASTENSSPWNVGFLGFIIPVALALILAPLILLFIYRKREEVTYYVRVAKKTDIKPTHPKLNQGCEFGYEIRHCSNRWVPGMTLHLKRGKRYTFRMVDVSTDFPFYITFSEIGGGNGTQEYLQGIQGSPATGKDKLTFKVPVDSPSKLYYQSTKQKCMGHTILISDEGKEEEDYSSLDSLGLGDSMEPRDIYLDPTPALEPELVGAGEYVNGGAAALGGYEGVPAYIAPPTYDIASRQSRLPHRTAPSYNPPPTYDVARTYSKRLPDAVVDHTTIDLGESGPSDRDSMPVYDVGHAENGDHENSNTSTDSRDSHVYEIAK